jgi:phage baseplate assembly protein W
MRPDFGCGAHELVSSPSPDTTDAQRVEATVREALARYEPRIELLASRSNPVGAADASWPSVIDYRVRATNQTGNLVYPFYFREGAPGLSSGGLP